MQKKFQYPSIGKIIVFSDLLLIRQNKLLSGYCLETDIEPVQRICIVNDNLSRTCGHTRLILKYKVMACE